MEGGDFRPWDELLPDALGLIFNNLSLHEVLAVVPRVCKSWERAVIGPYCWQEVDIEEWSQNRKPEIVDRMLQLLITRSNGSLRKLCVSGLCNDEMMLLIASHARSLLTLQLPRCEMNDLIVEKTAKMLCTITFLDLSYCINVGARSLEAIGKHCKCLTTFRRIMHPLEVIDMFSQDDEALAIAATMLRLKHLEIAYLLVDTSGVIEILEHCKHLEFLDVRGCWNVNLDDKFLRRFPNLKVVGPLILDCYDINGWDNCSDYSGSGSAGDIAWDFGAGDMDDDIAEFLDDFWEEEHPNDDVEMRFYDDINAIDAGYDWPQSP